MWFILLAIMAGVPQGVSDAIGTFHDGYLFFREVGMESEDAEYPRDHSFGIQICTDGCEPTGTDLEIEQWNTAMVKLWTGINTAETRFAVRAGDEALYYEGFMLFFADNSERTGITIHPEELWSILHHAAACSTPALGQVMVEAWYPGLQEQVTAFITVEDNAMRTVQILLGRGRESVGSHIPD